MSERAFVGPGSARQGAWIYRTLVALAVLLGLDLCVVFPELVIVVGPAVVAAILLRVWHARYRRAVKGISGREELASAVERARDPYLGNRLVGIEYEIARAAAGGQAEPGSASGYIVSEGLTRRASVFTSVTFTAVFASLCVLNATFWTWMSVGIMLTDGAVAHAWGYIAFVGSWAAVAVTFSVVAIRSSRQPLAAHMRNVRATRRLPPEDRWSALISLALADPRA
jgi:hypothetical protein